MKRILIIIGTRPEAIKLCPLASELRRRHHCFDVRICSTGQHREMLEQVFQTFEIKPDHHLAVMTDGQSLASVTSRVTEGLDRICRDDPPDVVLVQGDTTSAVCGALVGFYHHRLVGHIEAGLRTGNQLAPFPEEMNRRLLGQLADLHFAPTVLARDTLLREGIDPRTVFVTGNTVIDALIWVRERIIEREPDESKEIQSRIGTEKVVLVTGHRRESFGQGFENICQAIRTVADRHEHVHFVYPVHLNPSVQEPVRRWLSDHSRIHLLEPLSYESFVWLMNRATVVLTDSGGVQEEAPSLGKPVLVMREATERPEGVAAGNAKLVGTDYQVIVDELSLLLTDEMARQRMTSVSNPYGDGTSSRRIADILADWPEPGGR